MDMVTRTYYFPRTEISRQILNRIVQKVGCSIGTICINKRADTIRVPITCNTKDFPRIERILKLYNLLGDD